MGNPELSKDDLVAAMRGLSDVERATVYAEAVTQPESITRDDLKAMSPQQIVAAARAGQLDHLYIEQGERSQDRRDERAARSTARVQADELRRAERALERVNNLGPGPRPSHGEKIPPPSI